MHTEWTDRLSEYLDDDLPADERRAIDAHLAGCPACRAVLDELAQVVARARRLDPRPPQADLWPAVQRNIGRLRDDRVSARRFAVTLPQALAASLAIALLSGAAVWLATGGSNGVRDANRAQPDPIAQARPAEQARDERAGDRQEIATVSFADAQYDAAVADLEKAVRDGRGRLDKTTVDIVERNLQIIDHAIDQARQALDADPANSYLSSHLVEARRRKLDLLRRAAALTIGD